MPLLFFYTPWKHQKPSGFPMFSGGYRERPLSKNELINSTKVFFIGFFCQMSTQKHSSKDVQNLKISKYLHWLFLIKLQVHQQGLTDFQNSVIVLKCYMILKKAPVADSFFGKIVVLTPAAKWEKDFLIDFF